MSSHSTTVGIQMGSFLHLIAALLNSCWLNLVGFKEAINL